MDRLFKCLGLMSLVMFVGCNGHKGEIVITGKVKNASGQTLILEKQRLDGILIQDSVAIHSNNTTFTLSTKCTDSPEFYNVVLNGRKINLIADSVMTIGLNIDAADLKNYEISNSNTSLQVKQINELIFDKKERLQALANTMSGKTDQEKASIQIQLNTEFQGLKDSLSQYVYNDPRSFVAYYAIFQRIFGDLIYDPLDAKDFRYYAAVATSFQNFRPNNYRTKHLYEFTNRALQQRRTAEVTAAIKKLPPSIPEIALPNAKGDTLALSSLKGKVTILYFWTCLDPKCEENNNTLKELYKKYANKGLKIYQVSIDSDWDKWKKTVANQHLPWINVCDIEGDNSQSIVSYQVTKLPLLYLVGKDLNIYRGDSMSQDELDQKIKSLL